MVVLVTGSNGQLGQALQFISGDYPEVKFVFCSSEELDITNEENCSAVFSKISPDYCINGAAYTAVDKAESETERAYLVNVTGPENLAKACNASGTQLVHISTDFVFDGSKQVPYTEEDVTHPAGVYGLTKLKGEKAIQGIFGSYYIIRTSWVYSQFGNNFMKTMLRLAAERDSLSIVDDQIGTPTNAVDLSVAILSIITISHKEHLSDRFGIYNFSNEGQCSWYDFAQKIFETNGIKIALKPISSSEFPTAAVRPKYSVLDKAKIKKTFHIEIPNWVSSLEGYSKIR